MSFEDDHIILEDEVFAPNNEDGMIVLPEENIVSDEEDFTEPEYVEPGNETYVQEVPMEETVVAVAALDDVKGEVATNTRPRQTHAGAGVERIQMDLSVKGYGAKREFNLYLMDKKK